MMPRGDDDTPDAASTTNNPHHHLMMEGLSNVPCSNFSTNMKMQHGVVMSSQQ